jgi:hypothetical protein
MHSIDTILIMMHLMSKWRLEIYPRFYAKMTKKLNEPRSHKLGHSDTYKAYVHYFHHLQSPRGTKKSPNQFSLKSSKNGPTTFKCIEITRASKITSITRRVTEMQIQSRLESKALSLRRGNIFWICG